jgi:hypothetical protein
MPKSKINKLEIIDGYNGILPLDLSFFDKKFHKQAISQHNLDIKNYKKEQHERPEHLRYENTIIRINKQLDIEIKANEKRAINKIMLQDQITGKINT